MNEIIESGKLKLPPRVLHDPKSDNERLVPPKRILRTRMIEEIMNSSTSEKRRSRIIKNYREIVDKE